ncbi:glycosyltransferase [Rariglobus hedericola]
MMDELVKSRPPSARPGDIELYSPPFSRHHPELHPWVVEADIVHLHWIAGFVDWPRFFRTTRKPVVFTLHDQQNYLGGVHYENDFTANPWLAPLEHRTRQTKKAALSGHSVSVIGNSEWNTRLAAASGFFPQGTTFHTIPYALDTELYSPRTKTEAKAALGLPPDHLVIGFASDDLGNRRKGFDVLIQALRSLPAADSKVSLLSFGRSPANSLAASLELPWTHLGFIDADPVKAAAYSAMDVFIVPSRAEAFGQTAIEAMACGTPVIASNVGGLPEALDFGRCGLLVEPDRPDLLCEAIKSLLDDPARRGSLAGDARRHVVSQHDSVRHASACGQVYRQLLDRVPVI